METAEKHAGMPQMLATALKGILRDSYPVDDQVPPARYRRSETKIDRYRTDLNSEYFDNCVRSPDWSEQFKRVRDAFSEAKQNKIILAHGASCHAPLPLRHSPATIGWMWR